MGKQFARVAAAVAVAVAAAALGGCGSDSEQDLLASAKGYLQKNDRAAAVVQLKAALQKNPDSGEARYLLGKALLEGGDPAAAAVELNKAHDLRHDDNDVLPLLARAMLQQGQGRRLVELYGRTTLQDPQSIAVLKTALSTALLQQGERERAQAMLADALNASPQHGPAILLQAQLKAAEGDLDGALALIEQVLGRDPKDKDAWLQKAALVAYGKRDPQAGHAAYDKVIELDGRSVAGHTGRVGLALAQRDIARYKALIEEMRKALPSHPQTRFFEAQLALGERDFKRARELSQQLLKVAPENVRVLQLAGTVEFHERNLLQAETHLQKAITLAPELTVARRVLAATYLRSGQADKALAAVEPMVAQGRDFDSLVLAAEALLLKGDARRAEALFTAAARLRPSDATVRTALVLSRMARGNVDSALAELQQIAADDKAGTVADMTLISARLRRGDDDGALRAIEQLEKKQPDQPMAANLRGKVLLGKRDLAGARKSFARALEIDPTYYPAAAALAGMDLGEKKPDEARKHLDRLLERDPRNTQALLGLAELRSGAGAPATEVTELIQRAVQANPLDAGSRVLLVRHLLRQDDPKLALAAAREAAAALPDQPQVQLALGEAQLKAGENEQALNSFRKVAAMLPRAAEPQLRMAAAHAATNNAAGAIEAMTRATQLAPQSLPARIQLAELQVRAQRPDDAVRTARDIQKQWPASSVGLLVEGDAQAAKRDWTAALVAYRAALARDRNAKVASKVHGALIGSGQTADASRFEQAWLRERPQDVVFLEYLGYLAIRQKAMPVAEGHFRTILAKQPENPLALNNLAYVLLEQGKSGALPLAEKAVSLSPKTASMMDTLSLALASDKQFAKALETQREAMRLAPDMHSLRVTLARIYLLAGDKVQARKELEAVKALGARYGGQAEVDRLLQSTS